MKSLSSTNPHNSTNIWLPLSTVLHGSLLLIIIIILLLYYYNKYSFSIIETLSALKMTTFPHWLDPDSCGYFCSSVA